MDRSSRKVIADTMRSAVGGVQRLDRPLAKAEMFSGLQWAFSWELRMIVIRGGPENASPRLAEVRPGIEKTLLMNERQKQQRDWLLKLRKKAYLKLY